MTAPLEKLRATWRKQGSLAAVEAALDRVGFSKAYVDAACERGKLGFADKQKVVKDNVWGMIEIESPHLRLLDSPLVQRLRGIHQLGFSYLTYPSAEHTRFIHSLGMYCVVSRFLDVMMRRKQVTGVPWRIWSLDDRTAKVLKQAAILHDCGHLPFSHVTEQVLEAEPRLFRCGEVSVDDFELPVHDILETNSKFAECLSIAIVLTDRFKKFYHGWVDRGAEASDTDKIAALISGSSAVDGLSGIASLISGPSIDADKIDYINRDGIACGIPVGVDVSRLFLRSSFVEISPKECKRLRGLEVEPPSGEVAFVVNASGLDSIEEIVQARTALYHRVYLHQTTRNAERLLSTAIHADSSRARRDAFGKGGKRRFRDALQLWSLNDVQLMQALISSPDASAKSISERLQIRNLPKRANTFGRSDVRMSCRLSDVFSKMRLEDSKAVQKDILGAILDGLRADKLVGKNLRALELEIADEARSLVSLLRRHGHRFSEGVRGAAPKVVSVLPMPNLEPNRSDCIVMENRELSVSSASSITDEQMEATDIAKSRGYVLCDEGWREVVLLASSAVLFRQEFALSGVSLRSSADAEPISVTTKPRIMLDADSVLRRVGLNRDTVGALQSAAREHGYFDHMPLLAPSTLDQKLLFRLAKRLDTFCGQGNWRVTPESVHAFLQQFPPSLRDGMANLLSASVIFDRARLASDIGKGIRRIKTGTSAGYVVSLSPDSGNLVRYQVEQELRQSFEATGWTFVKSVRDALRQVRQGDHIVFCDDNVTSGSQAVCQFKSWLGAPKSKLEQLERGIELSRLDERDAKALRSCKIYIATSAGTARGEMHLKKEMKKLGLTFEGFHYEVEMAQSAVDLGGLERYLKDVGAHLLAWARHRKLSLDDLTEDQRRCCRRDALGEGGARALVCTPMNVPVGTITALWCPGIYEGRAWVPLLLRRGYLSSLVLS